MPKTRNGQITYPQADILTATDVSRLFGNAYSLMRIESYGLNGPQRVSGVLAAPYARNRCCPRIRLASVTLSGAAAYGSNVHHASKLDLTDRSYQSLAQQALQLKRIVDAMRFCPWA